MSLPRLPPSPAKRPQERWSLGFLMYSLVNAHRSGVLAFVDNGSRVSPAIEVGKSLTGERVVDVSHSGGERKVVYPRPHPVRYL